MKKRMVLICAFMALTVLAFTQDVSSKLDTLVSAYTNQYKFNGVVFVARGGKVLLEKGYGYKNYASKKLNDVNGMLIASRMRGTQQALGVLLAAARIPGTYAADGTTTGLHGGNRRAVA